jgi:hypothetical protein
VKERFSKWLYIEEEYNLTGPLCAFIANFVQGDPFVIVVVGPSGSIKTEVLRSFGQKKNQFVYPLSSITEHTFASGLKGNVDTIPQLQSRCVVIKDFTTILSKKEDQRAAIFADIRELSDGYLQKEFGSGVKKAYYNIHSSFLCASTNAIERYYTLHHTLGSRIMYMRPHNDPTEARKQSSKNQPYLNEMRRELHETMHTFCHQVVTKLEREPHTYLELPPEMVDVIGEWCDFLALARTATHHDFKGDVDEIPEPEFPTRLVNTICKLTRVHAFINERQPCDDDLSFARRVVRDNIPTMRFAAMSALTEEWQTTAQLAASIRMTTRVAKRALDGLAAIGICERLARDDKKKKKEQDEFKDLNDDRRGDSYRILPLHASAFAMIKGCNPLWHTQENNKEDVGTYTQGGSHPSIFEKLAQSERRSVLLKVIRTVENPEHTLFEPDLSFRVCKRIKDLYPESDQKKIEAEYERFKATDGEFQAMIAKKTARRR